MQRLFLKSFVLLIFTMIIMPGELKAEIKKKNVILLGASVGHEWNIESLPQRVDKKDAAYSFEFIGIYQFDKTKLLREALRRKQRRPDIIILKECAAYFPGDIYLYETLMQSWVRDCNSAGVIPLPVTVLPVIRQDSFEAKLKDKIKVLLRKPSGRDQIEQISAYNDWLKAFAEKERLAVLDLEACVRVSQEDRSLRDHLHSGDGLHLNRSAYDLLDELLIKTLDRVFELSRQK
jgi:hypothetical protein